MADVLSFPDAFKRGQSAADAVSSTRRPRLDNLANTLEIASLVAPAGYGKTTLLRRWQEVWQSSGVDVLWINARAQHADGDALARAILQAANEAPASAELRETNLEARVLDALTGRVCALIIDDAHHLRGTSGENFLRAVLCEISPLTRVALASRRPLNVGLAKLKLANHALELSANDLRLDFQESAAILNIFDGRERASLQKLQRAARGWPALVALAKQVLLREPNRASEMAQDLPSPWPEAQLYFDEEVLFNIPEKLASVVFDLGVLQRFSQPLLAALYAPARAPRLLQKIRDAGLPIDAEAHEWFSFHPMFAAHATRRLRQRDPTRLTTIYRQAAQWYAAEGRLTEAVRFAFSAGDSALAAELLIRASNTRRRVGRSHGGGQWAAQLPTKLLDESPLLRMQAACAHAMLFEHEAARALTAPVRLQFNDLSPIARDDLHAVDAIIAVYSDRPDATLEAAQRGLRDCSHTDAYTVGTLRVAAAYGWLAKGAHESARDDMLQARAEHEAAGSAFGIATTFALSGLSHAIQGRLRDAATHWYEAQKSIHAAESGASLEAIALGYLPETLYELNDLEQARTVLDRCFASGLEIALPDMIACLFVTSARLAFAAHSPDEARAVLDDGEVFARKHAWPRLSHVVAWERVRLALCRDDRKEATRLKTQLEARGDFEEPEGFLPHCAETEANTIGALRYEALLSPSRSLLARIRTAISHAAAQDRIWRQVRLLIIEAIAYSALGNRPAALRSMRRALELGAGSRMVRSFVDAGDSSVGLIEAIFAEELRAPISLSIDYLTDILKAGGRTPNLTPPAPHEIEPLSKRELEYVRMLAAGLSNADIGRRLFVSEHTVKWHLQHIYAKLNVRNRTSAIVEARARQLISPI